MSCGQCDQCLGGRPNTCRRLRFLGCPGQAEGCLSEFLVMPQECCFPIEESMTFEQAALSEPLTIGFYAARRALPMKGARIAILGAGPIGLSVLLCARAMGAHAIYMSDKIDARLAAALSAGATWIGNPDRVNIVQAVSAREPLLLDVVFECCGEQSAVDEGIELVRPGGRLMLAGIPEADRLSFVIDRARRKELDIRNVRRQCECLHPTLALMAAGLLKADFMITHRFRFDQSKEAFDLVAAYRDGVVKAIIQFGNSRILRAVRAKFARR
jgi:L-iditol 2-dehydrogenase